MSDTPIHNHKEICRKLAPDGWDYGGYDEGYYYFQTGNYKDGFFEMKLIECDLEARNIQYMADNKLTRV